MSAASYTPHFERRCKMLAVTRRYCSLMGITTLTLRHLLCCCSIIQHLAFVHNCNIVFALIKQKQMLKCLRLLKSRRRKKKADAHRAMCGKPSLQAMCSGVHPSSSLWWMSAPYWISSFTHSRFPDRTASWMAAMPALRNNHTFSTESCLWIDKQRFVTAEVFLDHGDVSESPALTRVVDGLKADSSGSDKTADPLQLALAYVVLENDVIREVHTADWLQRSRALAADWDPTVLGVSLDSHGLGHRAHSSLKWGEKKGQLQQHSSRDLSLFSLRSQKSE